MRALRSLNGEVIYQEYEEKVLLFFYQDMIKFLINNPTNVKLKITVNTSLDLENESVHVSSVKSEILDFLDREECFSNPVKMRKFRYASIFDYVDSRDDAICKIDSYTAAVILLECCIKQKVKKINLIWE